MKVGAIIIIVIGGIVLADNLLNLLLYSDVSPLGWVLGAAILALGIFLIKKYKKVKQ
jgi:hypothetical protein